PKCNVCRISAPTVASLYDSCMLLRFSCKNFRSIREEQVLSLRAVNTRTDERNESLLDTQAKHVKALRCAAIYGSNASGKSNVLRAMNCCSRMVAESQRNWNPTGGIPTWDPFALDEVSKTGETEFQVDFEIGSITFNYGFRFNARIILEEWLTDETGRGKTLFRRETDSSKTTLVFPGRNLGGTSEDAKHLEGIRLQMRPNSLFLSAAAQGGHSMLSSVFEWISHNLKTVSAGGPALRYPTAEGCSVPERKQQIKALLAFADVGIKDFEVADEEPPERLKKLRSALLSAINEASPEHPISSDAFSKSLQSIRMLHAGLNGSLYPLDFDTESSGTRAYFELLGPLLDGLASASCLLVDELESSLHPNLSKQLIGIFNDSKMNPKGAQLIFNTHDTNLLDLSLLRRDEIWFTEKTQEGATELTRLAEFVPRKGQNIANAYLHGRFGATPFLDDELLWSILKSLYEAKPSPISEIEAS
ncbi:MAG: ATP-binding protein, partial [Terracidiphilus sp.]